MNQEDCHAMSMLSPTDLVPLRNGRNNDVQLGELASSGQKVVVKRYARNRGARFVREVAFLRLCESLAITSVPGLVGCCENHAVVVMKHVPGASPSFFSADHEMQIIDFLVALQQEPSKSAGIPESIEAIWKAADFRKSLFRRIFTLRRGNRQSELHARQADSLAIFEKYLESALFSDDLRWLARTIRQTSKLPGGDWRFVSPSDMGVHNCLDDDGKLSFFDFEYAGVDSGVNLAGDLAMHPDSVWVSGSRHEIANRILQEIFESQSYDCERAERLFGTRWCLIALLRTSGVALGSKESVGSRAEFSLDNYIQGIVASIGHKI